MFWGVYQRGSTVTMAAAEISAAPAMVFIPIGGFFFALQFIINIVREIMAGKKGEPPSRNSYG